MRLFVKKNKLGFSKKSHPFAKDKKFKNPFFQNKKKIKFNLPGFLYSWRAKLLAIELVILFVGLAVFLFFSPIFQISNIEANGFNRIPENDVINTSWSQTNEKRFLIGDQNNLFLFSTKKLIKNLEKKYCFDHLEIIRKFPNILIVNAQEKSNSFIWSEGDKYFYADLDGYIIEEVNPLEIKTKKYPIINNKTDVKAIIEEKIDLEKNHITYINEIFTKIKNIEIDKFILDNEINTVKIKINAGPDIYFNVLEDVDEQLEKLSAVRNEKLKDDFNSKEYIDLRFGDRVYFR